MPFYRLTCYLSKKLCKTKVNYVSQYSYSTRSGRFFAEKLKNKCLIQLEGNDSGSLLQGLMTNDINHLETGSKSIYSLFLNNKGRIMFDTFITRAPKDDTYLIECETASVQTLEKHLRRYRLRKNVAITVFEEEFSVYVVYNLKDILNSLPDDLASNVCNDINLKSFIEDNGSDLTWNDLKFGDLVAYQDPRLSTLGVRVIVPSDSHISDYSKNFSDPEGVELHKLCRYWLGIVEGKDEIPYEKCFPLEFNCDYLHGVSFSKGCYIGQELTARSYHTGVIRKRIMPLILNNAAVDLPEDISANISGSVKKVGKVRGVHGKYAVALLRTNECLKLPNLHIGDQTARCFKPLWWPKESSKSLKLDVT